VFRLRPWLFSAIDGQSLEGKSRKKMVRLAEASRTSLEDPLS
jgi:hypothetical protein